MPAQTISTSVVVSALVLQLIVSTLWPGSDVETTLVSPSGVRYERGRAGLRVRVRGTIQLCCQRCLEAMAYEVQADATLVLAGTVDEIHAEPTAAYAVDRVVGGKEMPVRDLIEDELILAVPYAPRHEGCSARSSRDAQDKISPFAGLRGLMRGKH
jgi:uncharacterized protein